MNEAKSFHAILLFFALLLSGTSPACGQPSVGSCRIFPFDNVWNTRVDKLPIDKESSAYIASMNATKSTLYPVFNSSGWGMTYNLITGSQPKVPVLFYYRDSDAGPYPIPDNVKIQDGYDRHAILVDTTNCVLYELFNLSFGSTGWTAGSGAIFPLNSDALRPKGWTSADAAGLPIFPGMVRIDEVLSGHIDHALRVTADRTRNQYIWPARHAASWRKESRYPPMGQRFRLKTNFDISQYAPQAQVILQALKTYGMILADNGPSWDLTGVGDPRWDDAALNSLKRISGKNFEAVDESGLMADANSAGVKFAANSSGPIPDGWINVVSKNSGKCLDITGGVYATQPSASVQQWTCIDSAQTNQQFQFIPVSGGYEIQVRNSGLALQVIGGDAATDGARLEQWAYEQALSQVWKIQADAGGTYTIRRANNPHECVDVSGASVNDGAVIQQWPCNGGDNQKWRLLPLR